MEAYIEKGQSYEYYEAYFNPGNYFDEVYVISPWKNRIQRFGCLYFIQANPIKYMHLIKKISPVVVRAYGGHHCADWASISKVKNIPVVVSVHDTNPEILYSSVKNADHVICMSMAVKEAVIKQLAIPGNRISVLPNRIDVKLFRYQEDDNFFEALNKKYGYGKHILHVGRKSEEKNLETVIRSLKYLPEEYKVIFCGQGDSSVYRGMAKDEDVSERCFFEEGVKRDQLPLYYSWCDCMCTPSKWEGFGMVFIEAAACECAIVTSDISPMNEYLSEGENAFLVQNYENPIAIADAIKNACANSKEVQRLKKNARKVGEKFEKREIDKREIEIYENVIKEGTIQKKEFDKDTYFNVFWKFR